MRQSHWANANWQPGDIFTRIPWTKECWFEHGAPSKMLEEDKKMAFLAHQEIIGRKERAL